MKLDTRPPSPSEIAAARADALLLLNRADGEMVIKELVEKLQDALHSFLAASLGILRARELGEVTEHALSDGVIVARLVPREDTKRSDQNTTNDSQTETLKTLRPAWNEDRGELSYRGSIIRTYVRSAKNVRPVLNAFEELGWPSRVDDPSPGGKNQSRVNNTVKRLNTGLSSIRFHADGSGAGYTWEPIAG